jgi:hypothetical protein
MRHGRGWTLDLVGITSERAMPRCSDSTHLSLLPDPQDGISVGCIDFSLLPES